MPVKLGKIAAKVKMRYTGDESMVLLLYKIYEREGMDSMVKSIFDISNPDVRLRIRNYIIRHDWESPLSREDLTYLALLSV